jgi:capsular polysaccharide biosynthesis protein
MRVTGLCSAVANPLRSSPPSNRPAFGANRSMTLLPQIQQTSCRLEHVLSSVVKKEHLSRKSGRRAMSLTTLWRRLIRRPFVLVIIVAFAAAAGYAGFKSTNGEAQSQMSVLVVPPWYLEDQSVPNPMLNLTDRTTQLASTLVVALQSQDAAAFVAGAGATGYSVTNLRDNLRFPEPTSVIQFDVTGPDEQSAHAGAERLSVKAGQILTALQIDAAVGQQTNMAKLQEIVPPQDTASGVGKQQIRGAAIYGGAALLAGLLISWGVETLLDRRRRSSTSDLDKAAPAQARQDQLLQADVRSLVRNGHAPQEPASWSE